MSKPPVAGLVDRPDGEPASSQGDAITPLDVKTAAGIFTELLTTRDAKTGEPVPADATPEEAPAVSAAPSVADAVAAIPELEEVRRLHGETGVAQVLEALQQIQTHTAAEVAKVPEVIPEWRDPTVRAIELPEILKFARERGATDEQIAAFDRFGTAQELRNWRDFWRASHTGRRADERAEPAPAPLTDAARTSRPASDARQHARSHREARLQEASERVAKTGRLRDAGDAFAAMFIEKP